MENGPAGMSFVTKGDANQLHDLVSVSATALVGRVVVVSGLAGSTVRAVKTSLLLALVAFGVLTLMAQALWKKVPRRNAREWTPVPEPAAHAPGV